MLESIAHMGLMIFGIIVVVQVILGLLALVVILASAAQEAAVERSRIARENRRSCGG